MTQGARHSWGTAGAARGRDEDFGRPESGAVLLEVSWEVCNQVGGINQVLRSKASQLVDRWKDRYFLVGPYIESKAALEFEATRAAGWLGRAIAALREEGLTVHYGRWLIAGSPRALLVDYNIPLDQLNQTKYRLWAHWGIESPPSDPLINNAVAFGEAVRRLFEKVCHFWVHAGRRSGGDGRRVLGHFHEWQGGAGLPLVSKQGLPVATVFTTHATLLGRYIASNEEGLYERLGAIDPDAEAAKYGVKTQHAMERTCARVADVFTTVSAVTAEECTHLLGRTPDIVTPNGLNIERYYAAHQMQIYHAEYKERIHLFTMGHFFPSYAFDLNNTLYFFTSGRFEPRNKGFDLCLESLARLNAELKAASDEGGWARGLTVVFFIVTQRPTVSINPQVLHSRGVLDELREVCVKITEDVGEQLFRHGAAGDRLTLDRFVDEYWRLRYRRLQFALRTSRLPLVVTHVVEDDRQDAVLNQIRALKLFNRADDPVKVVYHPEFINPVNPLWGIEYEQFVRGCHLGIFPGAYEPWGYTPLECLALGVPTVTSDLAGFGRWVQETMLGHEELGISVLRRRGRTTSEAATDLTRTLLEFCRLGRRDRIALRNTVERLSWDFDWGKLGVEYHRAHNMALERAK